MRKVCYQIGVDVLGFPLYVTHKIYQDNPKKTKHNPKGQFIKVESEITRG